MAKLIVRGVDEALVRALKQRAAKHGRSAEGEHRQILASALRGGRKRSLAEVLATIPNVGKDEDFERLEDDKFSRGSYQTVTRLWIGNPWPSDT
jgi:antitoxin FitA